MVTLTDDEYSVLLIAVQGAPVIAIGRWKPSIESLLEKKYLRDETGDRSNCVITKEGKAAVEEKDNESLGQMIEQCSVIGATQKGIRDFAEQAAKLLAEAARASHKAIGDDPAYAAKRWSEIILRRALELLNG